MAKSRALLIGEHTLVLDGLRRCLEAALGVEGRVCDIARLDDALRFDPDVVVMHFPPSRPSEGLGQIRRLREQAAHVALVVLADDEDPRLASAALRRGVHGWVPGSSTVPELTAAVRAALVGGRHFTGPRAGGDLDSRARGLGGPRTRIRPRERQVLTRLAEGKVMKAIAAELGIAPRTVAFHKYRMMERLGIKSTAELLRLAFRESLVGPADPGSRYGVERSDDDEGTSSQVCDRVDGAGGSLGAPGRTGVGLGRRGAPGHAGVAGRAWAGR